MLSSLLLVLGIALLLVSGAALVRGASGIAKSLGVPPLVVGLTVVGFGTSAPELAVNLIAALENRTGLAFGNVVGSNIANLGLVLASAALIAPIAMEGQVVRRELPLLLLGTGALVVMALDTALRGTPPVIDRADGAILLLLFGIFIYLTVSDVVRARQEDPLLSEVARLRAFNRNFTHHARNWVIAGIGTVGLALGGQLTLSSGVELAQQLAVPTVLVGLFIVAIGTSLPELVTSIIAAVQREPDLCVGNVVGSNIFNSLMVLAIGALVRPIPIPPWGVLDLVTSFAFAAVLIPIFLIGEGRLSRPIGGLLLVSYIVYVLVRTA